MNDSTLLLAGWIGFSVGCLLTACAVYVIHDAMKETYYQQLDVLSRMKAQHEKGA